MEIDQDISIESLNLHQQTRFSKKGHHIEINILDRIKQVAEDRPTAQAVVNQYGESLTYSEMEYESTHMARYLFDQISKKKVVDNHDIIVGIALTRTNIHIVPLYLAVLKMGAAVYLVEEELGVSVNLERLKDIKPDLILVEDVECDLVKSASNIPCDCIDNVLNSLDGYRTESALMKRCTDNSSFIIYSSGSTGKPKMMFVNMSCLSNLAQTGLTLFRVENTSRVLQVSRRNFDAFVFELVVSVGNGATLVLIDREISMNPKTFQAFVNEFAISCFAMTPSHLNMLLETTTTLRHVKAIMIIGEPFSKAFVERIVSSGVQHILNGYGPSECGVLSICADLYDAEISNEVPDVIFLGQTCIGTDVRVMRKCNLPGFNGSLGGYRWKLCSVGEQGEVFLTNSLQNVYTDNNLNKLKYVNLKDPITGVTECYYRTGDIVDITKHGDLAFIGRTDNQVKIFGQLVVTDEVQNKLVGAAAELFPDEEIKFYVSVQRDIAGKPIGLTAHHTAKNQCNAERIAKSCSAKLKGKLPPYMIPKNYMWLPQFKIKVGGKLDTAYIKEKSQESILRLNQGTPIEDDVEIKISHIWSKLFDRKKVTWMREDKFVDFGGDSLLAILMCSSINEQFDLRMKTTDFIYTDSIADIAKRIQIAKEEKNTENGDTRNGFNPLVEMPSLVPLRVELNATYTLYAIHPGDGHVRIYQKLSEKFPNSYSVYGLRAPGSEFGEAVLNFNIEDYARRYGQLIKEQHNIDKNGINIAAFCGGGMIAIETARLLQEQGYEVKSLIIGDPPSPYHLDENNDSATWLTSFFNNLCSLTIDVNHVRGSSPNAKLIKNSVLNRTFDEQFDICYQEVVANGLTLTKSRNDLKQTLKHAMFNFKEKDNKKLSAQMIAEFGRMFFGSTLQKDEFLKLETKEEMIDHLMKMAREDDILPSTFGASFFMKVLEMCLQILKCTREYIPRRLWLNNCNIVFATTQPNIDQVVPTYPQFDAWKEYIPQASTHKFWDFDHYSLLREDSGNKQFAEVIRRQIEGSIVASPWKAETVIQ